MGRVSGLDACTGRISASVAFCPAITARASAAFSNALDLGLGGGSVLLGMLAQGWGLADAFLAASAALLLMLGVLALPRPALPAAEASEPAEVAEEQPRKVAGGRF